MNYGKLLGTILVGGLAGSALAQPTGPVQKDDIALGLSRSDANLTLELVRGGALEYNWLSASFIQSVEFDNLGGNSHNANGNLLGMNYGAFATGAELYSISTDGSDANSLIYAFDGTNETLTRGGGLSVSPDNTKIAMIGSDSASLNILDYTAGDGSGNGSATLLTEETLFAAGGATQGTAWSDNNTVLAAVLGFILGDVDIVEYDVTTGNSTTVFSAGGLQTGSEFTDIDYNPLVSPFVYVTHSSFASNVTENKLFIVDPTGWSLVNEVDLSTSCDTLREIALGFNNNEPALYMSMYGGDNADPGPYIDVLDISNPGSIADNSSVDYYRSTVDSSFNGIDYAVTGSGPTDCISLEVTNLIAGERARFTITNGTPGAGVVTVYGTQAGTTNVNNVAGYCVSFDIQGVNQSKVLGGLNRTFDGTGSTTFTIPIPGNVSGLNVLFQSAERGTCPEECKSNLVQDTVG